jgi:hypothetical protein
MMFITTPLLLFMNRPASHPAMPPMMIAASQPTPSNAISRFLLVKSLARQNIPAGKQ